MNNSDNFKVITRIKGGLGNQLFCYAAARRLALINDVELLIDNVTGFSRDYEYQRQYSLDKFLIPVRKAEPSEMLEPFGRYRRGLMKWRSRQRPFTERLYIEQEGHDFDERILHLKVKNRLYLEGYWQSELYFKDVEKVIRDDLQIVPPQDTENHRIAELISSCNSVALHVRWFDSPNITGFYNLSMNYYKNAINLIEQKVELPHYFLFSDNPEAASKKIELPKGRVTFMLHNQGDENAYADLWLMSQCRNFITANSTFSWWGAWLGTNQQKIVISPKLKRTGVAAWNFDMLIPKEWILL